MKKLKCISSSADSRNAVFVSSGGGLAPGAPTVNGGIGTFTLDGANFSGPNSRVLNMANGAALLLRRRRC